MTAFYRSSVGCQLKVSHQPIETFNRGLYGVGRNRSFILAMKEGVSVPLNPCVMGGYLAQRSTELHVLAQKFIRRNIDGTIGAVSANAAAYDRNDGSLSEAFMSTPTRRTRSGCCA